MPTDADHPRGPARPGDGAARLLSREPTPEMIAAGEGAGAGCANLGFHPIELLIWRAMWDAAPPAAPGAAAHRAMLDAVGEVIASKMRHDSLDVYRAERAAFRSGPVDREAPGYRGTYEGCLDEAESFVERLAARGYAVVPTPAPASPLPGAEAGGSTVAWGFGEKPDPIFGADLEAALRAFATAENKDGEAREAGRTAEEAADSAIDAYNKEVALRRAIRAEIDAPAGPGLAGAVRAYLAAQDRRVDFEAASARMGRQPGEAVCAEVYGRVAETRADLDAALDGGAGGVSVLDAGLREALRLIGSRQWPEGKSLAETGQGVSAEDAYDTGVSDTVGVITALIEGACSAPPRSGQRGGDDAQG